MLFLLIEDHPMVRDAIQGNIARKYPKAQFKSIDRFDNGVLKAFEKAPDFIVLDLELYGEVVTEKIITLKKAYPKAPLLVVSMHDDGEIIGQAVRAGANGYVTKHDPPEQVETAIEALLNNEQYLSERASSLVIEGIQNPPRDHLAGIQERLSKREFEIFVLLGKEQTRKQIAEQLNVSPPTVDTHIDRIKTKLELESSYKLLCLAIKLQLSQKK